MTTTVMIVDDQRITCLGPAFIIGKADDFRVIAQAENGQDTLDQLAEIERWYTPRPDVALIDVRMPVLNNIDAAAAITRKHPGVKVLVPTTYDQDDYAFGALGAGASGFLLKDTRTTDLHQVFRAAAAGNAILTPRITRQLLEWHMPHTTIPRQHAAQECLGLLTPREREVAGLVAQGMTNTEIGERLFIQLEPVKKTITRILAKLQLRDRMQLVIILCDAQPSR